MKLHVLKYCLLTGQSALSAYSAVQSVQILDAWLKPLLQEVAWELSRNEVGAADRAQVLAAWLDDTAEELKDGDALSCKKLAECLKAALTSLNVMLNNPSRSQAVKRAGSKYKSLQQLHSSFTSAAAAQQPVLAGIPGSAAARSSRSSSSGSPFAADISSQLARSAARPNQVQAFEQIQAYFSSLDQDKPAPAQLAAAMQASYDAMCRLREGVCKMMLDCSTKEVSGGSWRACQRQLDAWLAAFGAAYEAEQQLLEEGGIWPNIPAGVVEPTGAGKTGIINLAPFAALGPLAPPGSAYKVLVVTPNLAIRSGVYDSFSQQSGSNCLRDTLRVTSHPELLPMAFDLSTLPGMTSTAAAAGGTSGSSTSKSTGSCGRTSNNGAALAALTAAAAVGLESEDDDDPDDMYAEFDGADVDEDLMNNAAATAAHFGEETAATKHSDSTIKATAAAVPAGRASSPLQQLAAAHVVVANIQQLSMKKLEALFPRNYFDLIIMDEAHHAAARTWCAVLEYFAAAAKVLLTATPFRGDRAGLPMVVVTGDAAALRIKERIQQGLCSNVAYAPVPVRSVQVAEAGSNSVESYSGSQQLQQLSERYDIQKAALEDAEVRESTMRYSMQLAQKLRSASGQRHTIIAQASGVEDAEELCQQWRELSQREFGGQYKVDYTHTGVGCSAEHQARVKALAKAGQLDVVIHVGQLGEGFDAPALSVVAVFRVFRSMAPFMQLLGRAVRRIPAIPATHPANVAFLVAHPLLGYHKHWQVYCEERQDCPRELNARGKISNVRLVSFSYPLETTASRSTNHAAAAAAQYQVVHRSSVGSTSAAAAAAASWLGGQPAGLPGPDDVSYMVHPSEIAGSGRTAAAPASAPASPVVAAAAAAPAVAPAARVGAANAVHVASRQDVQQELQRLEGPGAATVKLADLRKIIDRQLCLGHITTSGEGRHRAAVMADVAAALQQMLRGDGVLSYQHLKQQQQKLLAPGIGKKDLQQVRDALDPWLSHVKLTGADRTTADVQKELLQAMRALIELQVVA